ncbi:MAG: cyclic nucleotide-binding domain-containing protein, partial [Chlorobi bacterium]|nr:cyclic nucleotide-binding domain-containing protein [Chlorobiota bacterium]
MIREKLLSLIKENKGLAEVDLSGENLDGLNSNLKHIEKNQVIYKNSDPANSIFLVVSGEVMISNDDEIKSYGEKEYFGSRFIGQNKKRNEKAIAVKPSIILEFILFENKTDERKNSSFASDIAISRTTDGDKEKQTPDIVRLSLKRDYGVPFCNSEYDGLLVVFVNMKKATLTSSK